MSVDDPAENENSKEETAENELEYEDVGNARAAAGEALEAAVEEIEEAGDDPAAVYAAEANVVDAFARRIGELIGVHGLAEHEASPLAGSLSEQAKLSNKTDIKDSIEEQAEGFAKGGDGVDDALNAYLENHVVEIVAVRSTDAKSSTLYRWHFEHDEREWYIETGEDAISHYKPFFIRTAIFDVVGVWPAEPVRALRGSNEWANWVSTFISDNSREAEHKGPRTVAVEAITNHIGHATAFPTIEAMIDRHGVRIDDDPEDGDPSEIWVPYSDIAQIAEDHGISPRALQVEVAARDLTAEERGNSVSATSTVRNEEVTYWIFDASIATPQSYDPNAETPTERIDRVMAEAEDEEDEEAGAGAGLIGSSRDDLEEMGLDDPREDAEDEGGEDNE